MLSIRGAKIFDLDENPVDIKRWTELENVREYYVFFKEHENEFKYIAVLGDNKSNTAILSVSSMGSSLAVKVTFRVSCWNQ